MVRNDTPPLPTFPRGHFYSPIVNIQEVAERQHQIWSPDLESAGIDYRPQRHADFIKDDLALYLRDYSYPRTQEATDGFFEENPAFAWLDSPVLFTMLRNFRPHQMVEVGSGYSSLLTADVNMRFLHGNMEFTCIEPPPVRFSADFATRTESTDA